MGRAKRKVQLKKTIEDMVQKGSRRYRRDLSTSTNRNRAYPYQLINGDGIGRTSHLPAQMKGGVVCARDP
jgi:hypothetical protein